MNKGCSFIVKLPFSSAKRACLVGENDKADCKENKPFCLQSDYFMLSIVAHD